MDDLESLFAWYKLPCYGCKNKDAKGCKIANCIRFRTWFGMAWKKVCTEVKEIAEKEGGGDRRWRTMENILNIF